MLPYLQILRTIFDKTEVGFQIGYKDHTGCHRLNVLTIRTTSVVYSRVSDWLQGPYLLSSSGCVDHTPY
jgi:hypothetical protein